MGRPTTTDTRWASRQRRGEQPSMDDAVDHLRVVHGNHPGFTETCASRCRDDAGRNSYEWLAELLAPAQEQRVLDLACGSGLLAEVCARVSGGKARITGVDMSPDELDLARQRLPESDRICWHCARAQELSFAADGEFDSVLCHWALTLIEPVEPVLEEVNRVLAPGGTFAAILDGDADAIPSYAALNDLIYGAVEQRSCGKASFCLGDPRVRDVALVEPLLAEFFPGAAIAVERSVVRCRGDAASVARVAVGFFYASYLLTDTERETTVDAAADLLALADGQAEFAMPIARAVVRTSALPA